MGLEAGEILTDLGFVSKKQRVMENRKAIFAAG